jgi:iron complex outermembrane receptor protein
VESAVAQAEDAFGAAVGQESVGIYTESDVRGFNPKKAGNARLDEVYFDHFALLSNRVKSSHAIRVGMAAVGDASPAPSGIVAYHSRAAGDAFRTTLALTWTAYGGDIIEVDSEIPIVKGHLGLAAGFGVARPHQVDGADIKNYPFGLMPRLRFGTADIKLFVSGFVSHDSDTQPLITTAGPYLPPMTRARRYLGQRWAGNRTGNYNNGVIGSAEPAPNILLRGGFVRSRIDRRRNFTEIFAVHDPSGLSAHQMLADPRQDSYADSWELFAAYRFGRGGLRQSVHLDVRNRHRHIESGGSQFFDYGQVVLGELDPQPKPDFAFGPVSVGSLDQRTYALGYRAALRDFGQVNLGVVRSDLHAQSNGPLGLTRSEAHPWLYNASLLVRPSRRLTLYAGYVSGLEDTGTAPENAVNRNQQLDASKTSQVDAGVQWTVGRMRLVATAFQMKKPYFSFDQAGRFVELGDLSHRGLELSAAGDLTERLHVLAGAVLMDPVVSGAARDAGVIGRRPVGTPRAHMRLDATWRTDVLGGVKLTLAWQHDSRRAASTAGYAALGGRQLFTPSHTTYDLGLRHNFTVSGVPVSLRFTVNNVFNHKAWKIIAGNTFQLDDVRRCQLFLIADF